VSFDGSRPEWPLAIAQVTPYAWGAPREVNEYVEHVASGLAARGHSVLVVAASGSRAQVRESRRLIRAGAADPGSLFEPGAVRVLAPMQTLAAPARRGGRVALPLDASRAIETLLSRAPLDIVHVHEPFAPSASAAALRHSRALNVGSFHSPTERVLSTQVARRFIELFFGRLDARLATFDITKGLISSFFPGEYDVVEPGADLERYQPRQREQGDEIHIAFVATEERAALRLFLRALRRVPLQLRWRATVWSPGTVESPLRVSSAVRDRVTMSGPRRESLESLLGGVDVLCATSSGIAPAASLVQKAIASGAVPLASRIPVYEEMLQDGEYGLLFEPGDAEVLSEQIARLAGDGALRGELRRRCIEHRSQIGWERVLDQVEAVYRRVTGRRHSRDGDVAVRRRLAKRDFIFCDLHMHTDHSPDCATPVDVLLDTAKRRGLGAIAITDHNEISGALAARELADGIKVIVSEEVKTAHEGEVIGLFIEEKIPRGMSMKETIDAIHAQGGLAYVPHPFDRLHTIPDYEHLLKVIEDIDMLEVFNARVAVRGFNEEAQRFADKYRVVAGAGSDSHVAQGLGTVKIKMRDFDGAQEFLESLRDADILHKRKSLFYLQGLKFLQTKTRPKTPRAARPSARR
jgi:predicted metal-dependent phosphoesterase TrpH/glycosyltransferase involved in cell wall biosynthesis